MRAPGRTIGRLFCLLSGRVLHRLCCCNFTALISSTGPPLGSGTILDETRASVEAASGFVDDVMKLADGLTLLEQYADSVCVPLFGEGGPGACCGGASRCGTALSRRKRAGALLREKRAAWRCVLNRHHAAALCESIAPARPRPLPLAGARSGSPSSSSSGRRTRRASRRLGVGKVAGDREVGAAEEVGAGRGAGR